jgi:hypothetical protein
MATETIKTALNQSRDYLRPQACRYDGTSTAGSVKNATGTVIPRWTVSLLEMFNVFNHAVLSERIARWQYRDAIFGQVRQAADLPIGQFAARFTF